MQESLTDRAYWAAYWADYKYEKVPSKVVYGKALKKCEGLKSFIEIGGFPGINALYFYKHICKDVSLLDFFIDKEIIRRFEKFNGVTPDTIHCIESDFFNYVAGEKYDIVFSSGFIEHFKDTYDVIKRHVDLLNEGGRLLIILPNFRGINGVVQWLFDKDNLRAHNLKSMDVGYLTEIAKSLDLNDITVHYSAKPMVWIEPKARLANRIFRTPVKLLSCFLKLFPVKGRYLSPFIILEAGKR